MTTTPRTQIFTVAVETAEAFTDENARDATEALSTFSPTPWKQGGSNLTVILTLAASSPAAAALRAEEAVRELAGMETLAVEAASDPSHLSRLD